MACYLQDIFLLKLVMPLCKPVIQLNKGRSMLCSSAKEASPLANFELVNQLLHAAGLYCGLLMVFCAVNFAGDDQ